MAPDHNGPFVIRPRSLSITYLHNIPAKARIPLQLTHGSPSLASEAVSRLLPEGGDPLSPGINLVALGLLVHRSEIHK